MRSNMLDSNLILKKSMIFFVTERLFTLVVHGNSLENAALT
jgi:hypothetical protein